jgi:hypothetical protein
MAVTIGPDGTPMIIDENGRQSNAIPLPDPTTLAGPALPPPPPVTAGTSPMDRAATVPSLPAPESPEAGLARTATLPSVIPTALPMSRFALTQPQTPTAEPGINPLPPPAPSYMRSSTDPLTGQPAAMNPSLTKLGKLLTVLRGAAIGGIAGSTAPSFGGGFLAAQQNQNNQIKQYQAQQEHAMNMQYLPFLKQAALQQAQAKVGLTQAQADRASSAASRWGAPKVSGTRLIAYNPDSNQYEDVGPAGTGKPATKEMGDRTMQYDPASDSWKDVGPAKAGTQTPYGKMPPETFGMLGAMPTTSKYDGKDYGDVRGAQQAWGRDAMAIKDNEAKAKAAGYATTRGQVVTDTTTGVTAPVDWATLHDAPPGRYVSPQYDPNTRLAVKAWQDLAPSGKVGTQVTSYNTFLRHTGDLYDAIDSLKNSGYPDWNKNLNWLRTHTGDPRVKTFLAKLDPVQKEFESFLLNNRALYAEDREAAHGIINENSAPSQMKDALQSLIHTGNARLGETNDTFRRATGSDIPDLISPEAQAALAKVGGPGAVAQMPPQVPRGNRIGTPRAPGAPPATPPAKTPLAAGGGKKTFGVPIE